jgi:hypothetical protein
MGSGREIALPGNSGNGDPAAARRTDGDLWLVDPVQRTPRAREATAAAVTGGEDEVDERTRR